MFAFNLPTSNILTIANLAAYNPTYYHQNYTFEPFINYVNITPNSPGYINLGLGLPQLALIEQEQTKNYTQLQNYVHNEQNGLHESDSVQNPIQKISQDNVIKQAQKQQNLSKKSKPSTQPKAVRPKKNVQSNISNQVFSYITNQSKSRQAIGKILKNNKQKIKLYYIYIQFFMKNKKKYLSRKHLGDLCTFALNRQQCTSIQSINKLDMFSIEEFRSTVGFLIFHYLRNKCILNVLTSMKLSSELRRQHLERKRQILGYLEQYVRPDFKYSFR